MSIETPEDLYMLREIGRIVAECINELQKKIQPGMSTKELDQEARRFLTAKGARSAPELVYQFPAATCISVSPDVAHGIPGKYRLKAGDIVNIDVSAEKNGYFADSGATFIVPPRTPEAERLCLATRMALERALNVARHGNPLNQIGRAIEQVAKEYGYTVIENLGSHGVGRGLHEEPEFIPGYYDPKDKRILKENTVITIEPFLSNGARWVDERQDGWTLCTPDRFMSAQYEHTLVITRGEPILITV